MPKQLKITVADDQELRDFLKGKMESAVKAYARTGEVSTILTDAAMARLKSLKDRELVPLISETMSHKERRELIEEKLGRSIESIADEVRDRITEEAMSTFVRRELNILLPRLLPDALRKVLAEVGGAE